MASKVEPDGWGRVVVADGAELAYVESGVGEVVLLVPGWTMSAEVFEHQLDGLAGRFRVIAVDPRGHGRSSRSPRGSTYSQHGQDLASLVRVLDLEMVHLVGWSYGALAAYAYVDQFGTGALRSFVAIDMSPMPLARPGWEWAEGDERFFVDNYLTPLIDNRDQFAEVFIDAILGPAVAAESRTRWRAVHRQTETSVAASLLVSAMLSDYRQLAGDLAARLPFANVLTSQWSSQAQEWLALHAPGAITWGIPSHMAFWEGPDDFNRELLTFLRSAARR